MNILVVLLSLIPVVLAGNLCLDRFAVPSGWARPERLALAFALGAGCLSVILFYVSLFYAPWAMLITLSLIGIASAGALFSVARNSAFHHLRGTLFSRMRATWWLVPLALVGLVVVRMALLTDLGFDGLVTWGLKAKVAYLAGGWVYSYFGDPWRLVSHLDYPLLVPSLEAWIYTWLGSVDEESIKVIFPFFYFSLLALFYGALPAEFSRPVRILYTGLLALTPYLASLAAISGYADVPLMLYVFGAAVCMHRWIRRDEDRYLILGAILSVLGAWTKREGLAFWGVNLVFVIIFLLVTGRRRILAGLFILPALALMAPWMFFLTANGVTNSDFASPGVTLFLSNLSRLPIIFAYLALQLAAVGSWGLLWVIWLIVLLGRCRRLDWASGYLVLITVGPLALLSLSFVFSLWDPFTEHLDLALERLVLQVTPMAWLFIAQAPEPGRWLQSMLHQDSETTEVQV